MLKVPHVTSYLTEHFDWTRDEEEALIEATRERVEQATSRYLETRPLPATAMFEHLYERLPADAVAQRAALANRSDDT